MRELLGNKDRTSYLDLIHKLHIQTYEKIRLKSNTGEFDRQWYSIRQIFEFPTIFDLEAWLYVKKHLIAERIWTKAEIDNFEIIETLGWRD